MYTALQFAPDRGGAENGHLRDCNQKGSLALPSLSVHHMLHTRYGMTIEKCLPNACIRSEREVLAACLHPHKVSHTHTYM